MEISTTASHFIALNGLQIKDKTEFISLVRKNFGAKALSPHYGLKIVRDLHGKMQETLTCVGCENFLIKILCNKAGWEITAGSQIEHGTFDLELNCFYDCEIKHSLTEGTVLKASPMALSKKRIHTKMNGTSSDDINGNGVITALKDATKTGKRQLSSKQISAVTRSLGLNEPSLDQVKKSMKNRVSVETFKQEFSLEAYAKALIKINPGMKYQFKTNTDGSLKYLVFVVAGAGQIFSKAQPIGYIDCAHIKPSNDYSHIPTAIPTDTSTTGVPPIAIDAKELEFVLPVIIAITCKTYNKNNHLLCYGISDTENSDVISATVTLAEEAGLNLNRADVVIMSDRGSAIIKSVSQKTPLAHHLHCAVHISRNLEDRKVEKKFLHLFWTARNARTLTLHEAAMKLMLEKCPKMHSYLSGIENWAIYRLVEAGIPLFELQSSNSVEQVFALPVILESRKQLPVTLLNAVFEWHLSVLMKWYDHVQSNVARQPFLTPAGQAHIDTIGQGFVNNQYTTFNVVCTNPFEKVYTVHTKGGMTKSSNYHTVNMLQGTCTCTRLEQMLLPCDHCYAVFRSLYGPQWLSKSTPEEKQSTIGDGWQYQKWAELYHDPAIYGRLPTLDDHQAEMVTHPRTTFPRTKAKRAAGTVGNSMFRFTNVSEAGKKAHTFGNRRVNAPCLQCGKMMVVEAAVARKLSKGNYVQLHEARPCANYAEKYPEMKEGVEVQLKVLHDNLTAYKTAKEKETNKTLDDNELIDKDNEATSIGDGELDLLPLPLIGNEATSIGDGEVEPLPHLGLPLLGLPLPLPLPPLPLPRPSSHGGQRQ